MTVQDDLDDGPRATAVIAALKTSIANELTSDDPTLIVRTTDYFNNTFAPDMVLSWPDQEDERQLFLRTNTNWRVIMEDLPWVSARQPIVMPLAEASASDDRETLQSEAARSSTLVTSSASVSALREDGNAPQLSRLLVSSVLRGGRGVMDRGRAARTMETVDAAYAAAQSADSAPVTRAVDELEELVNVRTRESSPAFFKQCGSGAAPRRRPSRVPSEQRVRWTLPDSSCSWTLQTRRTMSSGSASLGLSRWSRSSR